MNRHCPVRSNCSPCWRSVLDALRQHSVHGLSKVSVRYAAGGRATCSSPEEKPLCLETGEKLAKACLVHRPISLPGLFENESDLLARVQGDQGDHRPIGVLFPFQEGNHGCVDVVPRHILRAGHLGGHGPQFERECIFRAGGEVRESVGPNGTVRQYRARFRVASSNLEKTRSTLKPLAPSSHVMVLEKLGSSLREALRKI